MVSPLCTFEYLLNLKKILSGFEKCCPFSCIVSVPREFLPGYISSPLQNPPPFSWLGRDTGSTRIFYMRSLVQRFLALAVLLLLIFLLLFLYYYCGREIRAL